MTAASGDLTRGSLARKAFWFGLPISVALALHALVNLVDLVIIGRLPEGAIAAVQVPGTIVMVPMVIFDGICSLVVALVAQARGGGRPAEAVRVCWESLWIALGGTVACIVATPWAESFMRANFDLADAAAMQDGVVYLRVMMYGAGTMFFILATTAVLRGAGNSFWPMVILIGTNVVNLVLNLALVFGMWGFPALGVAGSAWASVIARGAGALLGVILLWRGIGGVALRGTRLPLGIPHWRQLILGGLPSSLQLCIRITAGMVLLKIVLATGTGGRTTLLDGVGISIRLEMIAMFVIFGWGSAATAVVGQNLGAGMAKRAAVGAWITVAYAAIVSVVIAILIWVFREALFHLVMPGLGAEGFAIGTDYLRATLPFYSVVAVGAVLGRALNGATSTKTPLVIDLVCYVLILCPLAAWASGAGLGPYLLGRSPDVSQAWRVLVGVHILASIIYSVVFSRGTWKKKGLAASGRLAA